MLNQEEKNNNSCTTENATTETMQSKATFAQKPLRFSKNNKKATLFLKKTKGIIQQLDGYKTE